jgi:ankyrin repeat protein
MTGILEWVAKEQRTSASLAKPYDGTNGTTGTSPSLSLKALVDVQDLYGDTALNVAARMGSRGLVRLLLDAGADKARGNKLGLRPIDFGVEVEVGPSWHNLWFSADTQALALTQAETVVANLKSENKKPEKRSRDVQKSEWRARSLSKALIPRHISRL